MKDEANTLEQLKITTKEETEKMNKVLHEAKQMRHNLQEDVGSTVQANIQKIVDSKMAKVEQAIHKTLQKQGKTITAQAKMEMMEMMEQMENQMKR
jgi:hypothetical protein